jgi:peptidyl-prolyl cis-trans isomerase SurA
VKASTVIVLIICLASTALVSAREHAVAVWVNDNAIYEHEVQRKMQPVIQRLEQRGSMPLDKAMREKVRAKALAILIERQAVLTSSTAKEMAISEQDVTKHLESLAREQAFGDQDRYKAYLEAQGVSWAAWLGEIKDTIIISRLKEHVARTCPPCTSDEAKSLYAKQPTRFRSPGRAKISLIVLDPVAAPDGNVRRFATGIQNRIFDADNDEWEACATEFSAGPKADTGGHLDWVDISELPLGLARSIRRMAVGDIEKITHGDYVYFVRLDAVEQQKPLPFEDARPQVESVVMQRKAAAAWTSWAEAESGKASVRLP